MAESDSGLTESGNGLNQLIELEAGTERGGVNRVSMEIVFLIVRKRRSKVKTH